MPWRVGTFRGRDLGGATPALRLRRKMGISQRRLALHAGVQLKRVAALDRLGREAGLIRLGDLIRIADALGVPPVVLVPGLALSPQQYRRRYAQVRPGESDVTLGVRVESRQNFGGGPEPEGSQPPTSGRLV
jgi:transcriptional regulator with XRE-family HTH domain